MPPALKYPQYRNYWLGMLASVSGFQLFFYGQLWLVNELTDSPLFLGYVGLANAVPAILLNLVGGVIADKFDRRRLLVLTQSLSGILIFLLATLVMLDWVEVWHVLAIAFFAGAVNAFDQPVRRALFPHLIERKDMMSAVSLNSIIWQGTRIIAPAAAGLIIGFFGTSVNFYVGGAGFVVMAVVARRLRVPPMKGMARGSAIGDLLEGVKYIKKHSIFSFLITLTFFNSFFGMAYFMLMPVIAKDVLEVGAEGMGVLLGASGVGALMVAVWMSVTSGIRRYGLLIIGGAAMMGLLIAALGLTAEYWDSFALSIGLLFLAGAAGTMYMNSTTVALQMMVPDGMRGRVMGFHAMTWSILPLSGLWAGALGSVIGVPLAVAIGGFAVAGFALGAPLMYRQARDMGSVIRKGEAAVAATIRV
jgi:MFS family permease